MRQNLKCADSYKTYTHRQTDTQTVIHRQTWCSVCRHPSPQAQCCWARAHRSAQYDSSQKWLEGCSLQHSWTQNLLPGCLSLKYRRCAAVCFHLQIEGNQTNNPSVSDALLSAPFYNIIRNKQLPNNLKPSASLISWKNCTSILTSN